MNPIELMTRYCAGDAEAFAALYAQMAPALFDDLLRAVPERCRAEELLQRVFAELHEHRATYVRGADPLPWLRAIASSLAREAPSRHWCPLLALRALF